MTEPGRGRRRASSVERYGCFAALLLVVLALFIRVPGTMEWWLNPDEGIYFSIATQPTLAAFWEEVATNAHPPLYYMILRGAGFLTTDFFWFRALSLMGAAAAVFAIWECAREIAPKEPLRRTVTGLAAAALLVMSPPLVILSQIMRPYMLQLALVAGALALLLRVRSGAGAPHAPGLHCAPRPGVAHALQLGTGAGGLGRSRPLPALLG